MSRTIHMRGTDEVGYQFECHFCAKDGHEGEKADILIQDEGQGLFFGSTAGVCATHAEVLDLEHVEIWKGVE